MVQPITIDSTNRDLISDRMWRERRHPQWTLNYELCRDTVITNRLTQRQSVNVPYMKKTLNTYLTQTNWPVDNTYENKANDKCAVGHDMSSPRSAVEGSAVRTISRSLSR